MDDALSIEDLDESAPSLTAVPLRARAAKLVKSFQRLSELYFTQTALIFPGRTTQGQAFARLESSRDTELVSLRTECGRDVVARFGAAAALDGTILPDAATRPTILFFYGNKGCLADRNVAHLFEGLRRRLGVNVMIPDYVGYGMSSGEAGEAGCYATADAAYKHLQQRRDINPKQIIVAGASLGGAVAIDLASRKRVAGLMTLITFTSMPDMARVIQPTLPIWRLIRHKFYSERKMQRVSCPTLIIHSTGDALVPYEMADRLANACSGRVSRLKIEGAGHNTVEMLEGGGSLIYDAMTEFLRGL